MKKHRRRILGCLLLTAAVLAVAYAARGVLLPPLARGLDVGQPPQRVDYVFVLPGGEDIRPFVAAALVRAGYAPRVLIPRNATSPEIEEGILLPNEQIIRNVLIARGVPADRVQILDSRTYSTTGDIAALAGFLEHAGPARVCVVTSHCHTRRTRWNVQQLLGAAAAQVSYVSAPTEGWDAENWWQGADGFRAVTTEYLKLGNTLLWSPTGGVLIALGVFALAAGLYYRHRRRRRTAAATLATEPAATAAAKPAARDPAAG